MPALQKVFATATTEAVALRLLDLDEPCVIAIVDDRVVAVRRGNRSAARKKLEPAEQECHGPGDGTGVAASSTERRVDGPGLAGSGSGIPADYCARRARRRIMIPRYDVPAAASLACSAAAVPFFHARCRGGDVRCLYNRHPVGHDGAFRCPIATVKS